MPSTVIRSFDYLPDRQELVIEFVSGRRYVYSQVPAKEVEAMRRVMSKGGYFNRRIRDRYPFRELVWGPDQSPGTELSGGGTASC